MQTIRVYRNINAKDKFLGLELGDGCVLLAAFFLAFSLHREGLLSNAIFLILVYGGLRALKRGKRDGYVLHLTRYALFSSFKRKPGYEECEELGAYGHGQD